MIQTAKKKSASINKVSVKINLEKNSRLSQNFIGNVDRILFCSLPRIIIILLCFSL